MKMMEFLVNSGADVHAVDEKGCTGLHLAASRGHVDAVKALLGKGANVHAVENTGRTALQLAESAGHADVVKVLKEAARPKTSSGAQGINVPEKKAEIPQPHASSGVQGTNVPETKAEIPQPHIPFPKPSIAPSAINQVPSQPSQPVETVSQPAPAVNAADYNWIAGLASAQDMECAFMGRRSPFRVTVDVETTHQQIKHQSIVVMPEYQDKSSEELRWEDYNAGFKPHWNPPFGTRFGAPAFPQPPFSTTPAAGFVQPRWNPPFGTRFGAPAFPQPTFSTTPASSSVWAPPLASAGSTQPSWNPPLSTSFGAPASPQPTFGPGFGAPASPQPTFGPGFGAPASPQPTFGPGFGAPASPQPTFGPGFGAPASSQPPFGTTPASSSVWATPLPSTGPTQSPLQPSMFWSTTQVPAVASQPGLFGTATQSVFAGSGTFGQEHVGGAQLGSASVSGTKAVPFRVTVEKEPKQPVERYQSIAVMPEYQTKSNEELRFEDYSAGNQVFGMQSPFSSTATPFTTEATSSTFGGASVQMPINTSFSFQSTTHAAGAEARTRKQNESARGPLLDVNELATLKQNVNLLQEQVQKLQAVETTTQSIAELVKEVSALKEQVKTLQTAQDTAKGAGSGFAPSTDARPTNTNRAPFSRTNAAGFTSLSSLAFGSSSSIFSSATTASESKPAASAFGVDVGASQPWGQPLSSPAFGNSLLFKSSATMTSTSAKLSFGGGVGAALPSALALSPFTFGGSSPLSSSSNPASDSTPAAPAFGAAPLFGSSATQDTNGETALVAPELKKSSEEVEAPEDVAESQTVQQQVTNGDGKAVKNTDAKDEEATSSSSPEEKQE